MGLDDETKENFFIVRSSRILVRAQIYIKDIIILLFPSSIIRSSNTSESLPSAQSTYQPLYNPLPSSSNSKSNQTICNSLLFSLCSPLPSRHRPTPSMLRELELQLLASKPRTIAQPHPLLVAATRRKDQSAVSCRSLAATALPSVVRVAPDDFGELLLMQSNQSYLFSPSRRNAAATLSRLLAAPTRAARYVAALGPCESLHIDA